jgi:peptide/nickel transport system permease protein
MRRRLPRVFADGRASWASATVAALALVALVGPWIAPYPVAAQDLEHRLAAPSFSHPLGLDELGRDVLSRLLAGARVSLAVGLAVVGISSLVGTAVGALAGVAGGWVDDLVMRVVDVFLAFPGILLAIALVAVLGPSLEHVLLALVTIGWVGYARLVRGQLLKLRELDFVTAARAAGVPRARLVALHLLPNVLPLLAVQASLGMAGAILAEASLSFLGLGIQPPTPSWGAMINAGRSHLLDAPHVTLFPGLAILASVVSLNFLGDALVDRFDPQFVARPR